MKKFVSLLLAAMMLLSCTVAMAENTFKASETLSTANPVAESATIDTNLYLQVEKSAQIDVTVPLVLLFGTNMDGGTATSPTNYAIENKNTRTNLYLTNIAVSNTSSDMTLVTNSDAELTTDNLYQAWLTLEIGQNNDTVIDLSQADQFTGDVQIAKNSSLTITPGMKTGPLTFYTSENSDTYGLKLLTITYTVSVDPDTAEKTTQAHNATFATEGN